MIGMSEALLALGGSLLAAGMAIWLIIQSRAQERASQFAAEHRETIRKKAEEAAERPASLRGSSNTTYILRGDCRPANAFGIPRAD